MGKGGNFVIPHYKADSLRAYILYRVYSFIDGSSLYRLLRRVGQQSIGTSHIGWAIRILAYPADLSSPRLFTEAVAGQEV